MKKIAAYECPYCGRIYRDKENAADCENDHQKLGGKVGLYYDCQGDEYPSVIALLIGSVWVTYELLEGAELDVEKPNKVFKMEVPTDGEC